jgi:flagellin
MAISMNTNTTAMSSNAVMNKANSSLAISHQNMGKGTKQLSAADSQIIGKMMRETSGLKVGQVNIKKATSMMGIAQGAFQSVNDLITQMKEKAFAATNVANGASERAAYQAEFKSLGQQLERVFTNTSFNGEKLLAEKGKMDGPLVFQTGTQNSETMKANFSTQLKGLMDGINGKGTVPLASGGGIAQEYHDKHKTFLEAESKQKALEAVLVNEKAAVQAITTITSAGTAISAANFDRTMRSVFDDTGTMTLAGIAGTTDVAVALVGDALQVTTAQAYVAGTATAANFADEAASAATVAVIEGFVNDAKIATEHAKQALDVTMKKDDFVHGGVANQTVENIERSQQATLALEKLAANFDEMNSEVQALMDSMNAQSEMQAVIIDKTEEAIGATRDTDYMEETSNIAANKLRNATAMAAVKQSIENTSTIIQTLINVNN